jgi:RNA polymerase sigma-70 factor (ECF subfamily)
MGVGYLLVGGTAMRTANFDENVFVEAARQGDLEAFNQIVLEYQDVIYNRAYWILNDPYRAEDLTQDTLLQAYQNLENFRGGSFRAWLVRIVTNACYDELRRRKHRGALSLITNSQEDEENDMLDRLDAPGLSLEESIEQNELRRSLQGYLDELAPEYREALYLVDILEMDYTEAADVMRVPLGTLKSRLARGRKSMRDRLVSSARSTHLQLIVEP